MVDYSIATGIMLLCPFLVIYFWSACANYQCSLSAPVEEFLASGSSLSDASALGNFVLSLFPVPTVEGFALYYSWLLFQALCYTYLPGKVCPSCLTRRSGTVRKRLPDTSFRMLSMVLWRGL